MFVVAHLIFLLPRTKYPEQTTPAGRSGLKNIAKIGQPIPAGWQEGKDFIKGQKLAAGDLVVIQRSDGSLKYGEVTGTTGMPWQNAYEVCVTVDATGNPGSSRAEEASKIGKIVTAAVSAAPSRPGTAPAAAPAAPQTRQGSGGFFGFPGMGAPQPSANANANGVVDERKRQQDEAAAKRQAETLERQRQAEEKQRAQQAAMEDKKRQMAEAAAKRQAEMDEKKRQQEEAIRARQQAQMQEQVQYTVQCCDKTQRGHILVASIMISAACMFVCLVNL